jgi:acetyltransferase-like isoleucine patch superfamily enzyme
MRRLARYLLRKLALAVEGVLVAEKVQRLTANGAVIGKDVFFEGDVSDYKNAPFLTLEDGCTVSRGTMILLHDSALNNTLGSPIKFGKVVIGKESYIGAHSLVNTDIPDEAVAYGVPAKVMGNVHEVNARVSAEQAGDGENIFMFPTLPWRKRKESQSVYRSEYDDFVLKALGKSREDSH